MRRPEDADKERVAIGWSELGVTRDHVTDRGDPLDPWDLGIQSDPDPLIYISSIVSRQLERYAQLNIVRYTY
jgi:hypothetical protein